MAVTPDLPHLTICDAGPIIHLDEMGCLDLLEGFGEMIIPNIVWQETRQHRPLISLNSLPGARVQADVEPSEPRLLALCRSLDLDAGERSALAILQAQNRALFLTDDSAARLACELLGYPARGSVGVIVRSIRRATRTVAEVRALLSSLPQKSTLHLHRSLLEKVIAQLPAE